MSHIKRHARHRLLKALNVSPVVFLNGPRQAGKSTLVQSIAKKDYPAEYVTFDSTTQMAAAANSPESYLKERKGIQYHLSLWSLKLVIKNQVFL